MWGSMRRLTRLHSIPRNSQIESRVLTQDTQPMQCKLTDKQYEEAHESSPQAHQGNTHVPIALDKMLYLLPQELDKDYQKPKPLTVEISVRWCNWTPKHRLQSWQKTISWREHVKKDGFQTDAFNLSGVRLWLGRGAVGVNLNQGVEQEVFSNNIHVI